MHEYHEGLPGYDPSQIWHDGCGECEARGADPQWGMGHLDRERFARAWARAADCNRMTTEDDYRPTMSKAEEPLLAMFWRIQVMLERNCGIPLGTLPRA
jgi:hypothetical protein